MERRVEIGEESLSLRKEMAIEKSLCYRRLGIQSGDPQYSIPGSLLLNFSLHWQVWVL